MNLSWRVKKIVSAPNPGLYRCTANEKSVNEVGRRGCCPVDFKDLRATIALGWAWLRRRVSVVVRTAISVQRENGGREYDLMFLRFGVLDIGQWRKHCCQQLQKPMRAHHSKNVALFSRRCLARRYAVARESGLGPDRRQ